SCSPGSAGVPPASARLRTLPQRLVQHARRSIETDFKSKKPQRERQRLADTLLIKRRQRQRAIAFAELRAIRVQNEWQMRVRRSRDSERALQRDLARRGR